MSRPLYVKSCTSSDLTYSQVADLKIFSTRYPRGAVVKLTASHSDQPLVKFVIERNQGAWSCRCVIGVEYAGLAPDVATEAQFIEYAERECERIRTLLGGSHGPR